MAQFNLGTINASTKSGTQLASDLTNFEDALFSTHSGSSAPSYVTAGLLWGDSTSSNIVFNVYDGSDNIPVFQIDATNDVARVGMDADGDTYIVADVDDRLRAVAGGGEAMRIDGVASGVNYVSITNAATGNAATIAAAGSDANVDLDIGGKGSGLPNFASGFKSAGVASYALGTQQFLTSGTTYTVPSGCRAIEVICIGGGGGGGGTGALTAIGLSGGGGAMVYKFIDDPAGADGGDTTFTGSSVALSAGGGDGGAAGPPTSGTLITIGEAGGTASGGDVNIDGAYSGNAATVSGDAISIPLSGASPLGGGAVMAANTSANGTPGGAPGAGGSGGISVGGSGARIGGAGAAGLIIVKEFY
jgi:hypothetical protein